MQEGIDYKFEFHQVRTQEECDRVLEGRDPGSLIVFTPDTSPGRFVRANGIRASHVFQSFSDPLADGWIRSYARPGGNTTGVIENVPVHGKRLDLLADLVPRAARIGVVFEATSVEESVWNDIKQYEASHPARSFLLLRVSRGESAEAIAARLRSERIDAVYVPLVGEVDAIAQPLFAASRAARLAAVTERHRDLKLGAVMSLQVDRRDAMIGVNWRFCCGTLGRATSRCLRRAGMHWD
jgi:ABC-type uncharacterized transport system substrate-binding protein